MHNIDYSKAFSLSNMNTLVIKTKHNDDTYNLISHRFYEKDCPNKQETFAACHRMANQDGEDWALCQIQPGEYTITYTSPNYDMTNWKLFVDTKLLGNEDNTYSVVVSSNSYSIWTLHEEDNGEFYIKDKETDSYLNVNLLSIRDINSFYLNVTPKIGSIWSFKAKEQRNYYNMYPRRAYY